MAFKILLLIQNVEKYKCKNCYSKRDYCYLFSYTFFSPAFTTSGILKHNPFHTHFPGENQYETLIWAISSCYTEKKVWYTELLNQINNLDNWVNGAEK